MHYSKTAFTLVELLVVIAIIGMLTALLLPAVQAARESSRRMQCANNLKQLGLATHGFESANSQLPHSGQCDSTGSDTTTYMIHSTATMLLPFLEQIPIYNQFDFSADPRSPMVYDARLEPSGRYLVAKLSAQLNVDARGISYDDSLHPSGIQAAKTKISTFICPSTPIAADARDPVHNLGGFDYMFIALSDVDANPASSTYLTRTPTSPSSYWQSQVVYGMLNCQGGGMQGVTDGLSNTVLCTEDGSRSHPSNAIFGSRSARTSPTPNSRILPETSPFPVGGRRVHAWADPDTCTNGYSGPSNAIAPASRVAKLNNYKYPLGGPPECKWGTNNCGPNDEPFSFHEGGINAVMGDGSVRFLSESVDPLVVKWQVGATDGNVSPVD